MIAYRHCDRRYPFLWEDEGQPAARWHAAGAGPAHYFADTPGGAWAEFLRHEEITDPRDVLGVSRALWAVEIGEAPVDAPALPVEICTGGEGTYLACQAEASRLRAGGASGLVAQAAALQDEAAGGWRVDAGLQGAAPADGRVFVIFGPRPDLVGWLIVDDGHPPVEVLPGVRHF